MHLRDCPSPPTGAQEEVHLTLRTFGGMKAAIAGPTKEAPMIDDWYATRSVGDGVTLIWERHIKPSYGANMWHVRGRDCSVLIDTGFGLVSLIGAVPELREQGLLALGTHTHCDHVGGHH